MTWLATAVGGSREAALPGQWALLVLIVALIAVLGAMILINTYARHERAVARRRGLRRVGRR
jgi:hypothetical protein